MVSGERGRGGGERAELCVRGDRGAAGGPPVQGRVDIFFLTKGMYPHNCGVILLGGHIENSLPVVHFTHGSDFWHGLSTN